MASNLSKQNKIMGIKEPVKINAQGKVVLTLTKYQAELIKPILEGLGAKIANSMVWECKGNKPLTPCNALKQVQTSLLIEIMHKYYRELDLVKDKLKLTLSKAQAVNFWYLSQTYTEVVYCHPVMNNLMYHLHLKLS
ncbi:MAG: hypothetical protein ACFB2Y_16830 [Fulvivirga sp.]